MRSLILLLVFIGVIAASAWTIYYINSRNINEPLEAPIAVAVATPTPSPTATPTPTPAATPATIAVASVPVTGNARLPQAGGDVSVLAVAGSALVLGGAAAVRQQRAVAALKKAYRR
jgi:hypothetical protein